jgi:hypothetical protein
VAEGHQRPSVFIRLHSVAISGTQRTCCHSPLPSHAAIAAL